VCSSDLSGGIYYVGGSGLNAAGVWTTNLNVNSIWANWMSCADIYYQRLHPPSDAVDDFAILRSIKTVKDEHGNYHFDEDSLHYLQTEDEDGNICYSLSALNSWHLSVERKLLEAIDNLTQKLDAIHTEVETLKTPSGTV
jgi:hypothetical protein